MNKNIKPELATLVKTPPTEPHWIHEIKFDGYRILSIINKETIRLLTRNGKNWANKFPTIVNALKTFPYKNSILDGELVVLDKKGRSRFQLFQNALTENKSNRVHYFIFDIPYFNNKNLSHETLLTRKKVLETAFKHWKHSKNIILTDYIQGHGKKAYQSACKNALEGIVSKEFFSHYEQKRTRQWLKSKCGHRQEFIIVGYTQPKGSRQYFGALLLGVYDRKTLSYCGRVGTGFNQTLLETIFKKLEKFKIKHCPIEKNAPTQGLKEIQWVNPVLVGEVSFTEWTNEGALRHPSFLGLRLDKDIKSIKRELP